ADVADDDAGEARRDQIERGFRAGEVAHLEAGELQRLHGRASDILLVVDDEHGRLLHSAASRAGAAAASSVIVATVPPSLCSSTTSVPPKSLTMLYEIDRPRPNPLPTPLVEKNGSKIRSAIAAGMPAPRSRTVIVTLPSSAGRATSSILRLSRPSTASAALEM